MDTLNRFSFIRTTVVGGLLFLVPIIALSIILGKALGITRRVVRPLASLIGIETIAGVGVVTLLGIFSLILFCFLAGLFAKTAFAKRIVDWLESRILSNIPGYTFMKRMGESYAGTDIEQQYEGVLARFDDGWQIAFLIERIEGGQVAVFIPDAPNPWSGSIFVMTEDRIKPFDAPTKDVLKCVQRLGAGSNSLLQGHI